MYPTDRGTAPKGRHKLGVAAVSLALVSVACGHAGLAHQYAEMRPALIQGDWVSGAAALEGAKDAIYGEKDRVMYWLNLGTAYHYTHAFDKSNENFNQAERAMDELFTQSITAEISKVLINETIQSYAGEDFEKVLVYLYTSLNNMQMGKTPDAIVEARRADELLKKMQIHFDKEGEGGTIYRQDAFMLWLVGLYYEIEGGTSLYDAFQAYRAALKSYETEYTSEFQTSAPAFVQEDAARVAILSGQRGEARNLHATGETADRLKNFGELIVIHANGEAPFKQERRFDVITPDGLVMSVAVPEFVECRPVIAYAEVTAGGTADRSVLAEPISEIVLKNFAHRLPAIKARAAARVIGKYVMSKTAEAAGSKKDKTLGHVLGFMTSLAGAIGEVADLRSWTLLPAEVRVARLWLPAGTHAVSITYHDARGRIVGNQETYTVEIATGQRRILSVRSIL